ncbi:hypothetical protein [Cytobacillus praedii]|uniref:Uncharacterized protein n=1 Tax=Cytobacillus praedii TaxID=1742358 RepID=A0A4R1AT55_9BACI|nr:hypothetical protein [Cytobacillus praedii]TCJ01086.1 hypothetical protein E0Y62_25810 [Cytobacillus praedii]
MAKKNTDIKFSTMKQKAKEVNLMEQYAFDDDTTLSFYPIFPPTLIEEMISNISTVLTKEGDELQLSEDMMHKFIIFHCIRKFTHLSKQLKAETFSGQLTEMEAIIDSGYFEKIVDEVFLSKEIHKVFDAMTKISSNYMFLEKMTQKMHDEVSKLELKNKHIFENLNLNKSENNVVN